jgi:hypothetical protein
MSAIQKIVSEFETRSHLLNSLPNDEDQFVWAAAHLATGTFAKPKDWGIEIWHALINLNWETRVAVAACLMAIAIDKANEAAAKKTKNK